MSWWFVILATMICLLACVGVFTIVILIMTKKEYPNLPPELRCIDDFERMADKGEKK